MHHASTPNPSYQSDAKNFLETFKADLSFQCVGVLPGDDVTAQITRKSKRIRLGGGLTLQTDGKAIAVTRGGILRHVPPNIFWVDTPMRRYEPRVEDAVIGVIDEKAGGCYRVNIWGTSMANLDWLAFQGATKKNKPSLVPGDLVYARIAAADPGLDIELSCVAVEGSRIEWSTGKSTFGPLSGGAMVRCSLQQAMALREPDNETLELLGDELSFELVSGANGVVWIKAAKASETVLVSNAILNSFALDSVQVPSMIQDLLRAFVK